jgi:GntR family transcriptional regulator
MSPDDGVRSRRTLVEQVREGLLAELLDGRLAMGSKLPNEQDLATRMGVSRATVREAVGGLIEAGYIARRHGSGTYVIGTPRQHTLDTNLSYRGMITAAGMTPGLTVLSTRVRKPSADEAERLGVDRNEPVVCVERIRTADGKPIVYSQDRFPRRLVEEVPEPLDPSLYRLLATFGVHVRSAAATLLPVLADDELALLLAVHPGIPLQFIDQVDFDDGGNPVMLSYEWHVPDVLPIRVNRRGVGATAR